MLRFLKESVLLLCGITITILGVVLTVLLCGYGVLLKAVFHPTNLAQDIMDKIGKMQTWIEKKLERS